MDQSEETFGEYLNRKYHETALNKGGRHYSIAKWAKEELGLSNASMSNYMTGKRVPNKAALETFVAHFGLEVFDKLNIPRPKELDLELIRLRVAYEHASPEDRAKFIKLVNEILPKDHSD